jgi:hypothetical protein
MKNLDNMRWNSWDQYSMDLKNWFRTMRSFNRFELFIYNTSLFYHSISAIMMA